MKAKMKDKKGFWDNFGLWKFAWTYGWTILVVLVAIGGLAYYGVYNIPPLTNKNQWCERNIDKCVCEGFIGRDCFVSEFDGKQKKVDCALAHDYQAGKCQYRKLTPQELLEKSCNENPREDEKCKCLEYKDTDKVIGSYACPDSCREITIKECKIKGLYHYSKEIEYEGNIIFDDYCELNSIFEDRITDARNVTMQIIERNITNCERCYKYEQVCVKSRLKTECEKGNPDWLEETKQHINTDWIENCCKDITINIKNNYQNYIANKICFEADSKDWQSINSINTTKCEQTPKYINQTICREKTEEERWEIEINEIREKSIKLRTFETKEFTILEEYDISYILPDRYRMEIKDIQIINKKQPYSCLIYCPDNTTIQYCELATCYRNYTKDCIELYKDKQTIENKCNDSLILDLKYRYIKWRKI